MAAASTSDPPRKIVICGGGIIGVSIAYYLMKLGHASQVTLVERVSVACHASGKAGGFLALNWCDNGPVGPLARKSFAMHRELAHELGSDCGYREMTTLSVEAKPGRPDRCLRSGVPEWLNGNVQSVDEIGTTRTTAQVHPKLLCDAMFRLCQEKGTTLIQGTVKGITTDSANRVTGVRVDEQLIPADDVVIALGPWSHLAKDWFPEAKLPKVSGRRAHSIVARPTEGSVSPHAVFLQFEQYDGTENECEVYPRPDGSVYICGAGDKVPIPENPADIEPDPKACQHLQYILSEMSSNFKDSSIEKMQACYLPYAPDGKPLIGRIPRYSGGFIATGHGCWGILNGPATGIAMAELITLGESNSVAIEKFNPKRFL